MKTQYFGYITKKELFFEKERIFFIIIEICTSDDFKGRCIDLQKSEDLSCLLTRTYSLSNLQIYVGPTFCSNFSRDVWKKEKKFVEDHFIWTFIACKHILDLHFAAFFQEMLKENIHFGRPFHLDEEYIVDKSFQIIQIQSKLPWSYRSKMQYYYWINIRFLCHGKYVWYWTSLEKILANNNCVMAWWWSSGICTILINKSKYIKITGKNYHGRQRLFNIVYFLHILKGCYHILKWSHLIIDYDNNFHNWLISCLLECIMKFV